MADFLRDLFIKNRAFTEASLGHIYDTFVEAKERLDQVLPGEHEEGSYFSVVIRFDNQGYRVWSLHDLTKYFRQAQNIERVSFELDTSRSLQTSRNVGAHCILQLDSRDPNRCLLQVACDDRAWVEQTFAEVSVLTSKRRTLSRFARTPVTNWLVQVSGISLGVVGCIWGARAVAPTLSIENPFLIAFLVALLIFSNTWTYLLQAIGATLARVFPNVMFLRAEEERLHWMGQAVVGLVITGAVAKVGTLLYEMVAFAVQGVLRG